MTTVQLLHAGYTGDRVEPAGDMDGDQVPDWLVSSPNIGNGRVQVISGATLIARNLDNPGPGSFTGMFVLIGSFAVDPRQTSLVYAGSGGTIGTSPAPRTP